MRLTGIAWHGPALHLELDADDRPELVLHEEETGATHRVHAEPPYVIDLADVPLPRGVWRVVADGVPVQYEPELDPRPQRVFAGPVAVTSYFSPRDGGLTLDVGGDLHAFGADAIADRLSWRGPDPHVVVAGHIMLPDLEMATSVTLVLRRSDVTYDVIASTTPEKERISFSAAVPLLNMANGRPLPRGDWEVRLKLAVSGIHRELGVQSACEPFTHSWWRRGVPMTVAGTPPPARLQLVIRPMSAHELRASMRRH